MGTELPVVVNIKKHQSTVRSGYIYCVYDGAVEYLPGASLQVKCGKTTHDPVAYCVRTYGRHMGKLVIASLAQVSDVWFSESLLFRILDDKRVVHVREVFAVESLHVVRRAFEDLVSVFDTLGRNNPKFVGRLLNAPETKVIDSVTVDKTKVLTERRAAISANLGVESYSLMVQVLADTTAYVRIGVITTTYQPNHA